MLKINLVKLSKCSTSTLKIIRGKRYGGNYSGNSDVWRYAEGAWRASFALCELSMLGRKNENDIEVEEE